MKFPLSLILLFLSILTSSTVKADNNTLTLTNDRHKLEDAIRKKFIVSYDSYNNKTYGGRIAFERDLSYDICKRKFTEKVFLDHEGGLVNRINSDLPKATDYQSKNYYSKWERDIKHIKSLCIDGILGPVIDKDLSSRSPTNNIEKNILIARKIVDSIEDNGLISVVKHFPGYIKSCYNLSKNKESMYCNATINDIKNEWKNINLQNIKYLMISHTVYNTSFKKPAFADPEIIIFLKHELNYKGIIITDALNEVTSPLSDTDLYNTLLNVDYIMYLNSRLVEHKIPLMAVKIKSNKAAIDTFLKKN